MKFIGLLLLLAIFGFIFFVISRNMGVKDTIEVFALAVFFSTLLEFAFWLMIR